MSNSPYTQHRQVQYRGPSDSSDYNARVEENYKDLVVLYNTARVTSNEVADGYARLAKDQDFINGYLLSLASRVAALESQNDVVSFYNINQIDTNLFASTPFAIPTPNQLTYDTFHGVMTLPQVLASSTSNLSYTDSSGNTLLPPTLQLSVTGAAGTADSTGAYIDTSDPEFAIARASGRIWERNVVVNAVNPAGAQLSLYVRVPTDLFTTGTSNALVIHPFPAKGCTITSVAYTTVADVALNDSDGYTPLNSAGNYANVTGAVGWIPPGSWSGDAAVEAGPSIYHFDPLPITGLKITLTQPNPYFEGTQYIYSYGMSQLDLRYNKYLTTGQTIIRFDAPAGKTISTSAWVEPQIWNVPQALYPSVFSSELVWETSYQSGVYTTTPVIGAKRVWALVTLNTTPGGGTPALSGLVLNGAFTAQASTGYETFLEVEGLLGE